MVVTQSCQVLNSVPIPGGLSPRYRNVPSQANFTLAQDRAAPRPSGATVLSGGHGGMRTPDGRRTLRQSRFLSRRHPALSPPHPPFPPAHAALRAASRSEGARGRSRPDH